MVGTPVSMVGTIFGVNLGQLRANLGAKSSQNGPPMVTKLYPKATQSNWPLAFKFDLFFCQFFDQILVILEQKHWQKNGDRCLHTFMTVKVWYDQNTSQNHPFF